MPANDRRETPAIDAVSRAIIDQLRLDGRKPYAAIAKAVGLSEAAVRQRVQRLVESGIVRIVAVTDARRLGLQRHASIGIKAEGDLQELGRSLAAIPEVDHVVITAGAFDVLVEVLCHDDEHLLTVLNGGIRSLPGVLTTETFVHLEAHDHLGGWTG
ncbi:Lrp/AsnC family transcriptional regulator [Cellulomonas bogoriensis]|uniref:AsnC family transcriptional regulator n=1 Tax=Cellulomonas bogoriensis 69B4 = DSM 16987 TaxID=1386082 RepID=A0A0A0C2B6_9CELL|nr:AsnC family transcriptional regulator [Cellulomonas bogoriensis 69B4 = DSM 16987]